MRNLRTVRLIIPNLPKISPFEPPLNKSREAFMPIDLRALLSDLAAIFHLILANKVFPLGDTGPALPKNILCSEDYGLGLSHNKTLQCTAAVSVLSLACLTCLSCMFVFCLWHVC